ncbi:MAG: hypothetical protein LWW94_11630 [Candidatus Desulfofervidaceae bacterium]|nr:hypothetical protein [Candidatus Desulfofervidaceae bacterium]
MLTVNYSKLSVIALQAVKELHAQVEEQRKEIERLKSELANIQQQCSYSNYW